MCWGGFEDCSLDIAIDPGTYNLPQVKKCPLLISNFREDIPVLGLILRQYVKLSVVSKNLGAANLMLPTVSPTRIQIILVDTVLSSLHTAEH
jgi:hypothetical protein